MTVSPEQRTAIDGLAVSAPPEEDWQATHDVAMRLAPLVFHAKVQDYLPYGTREMVEAWLKSSASRSPRVRAMYDVPAPPVSATTEEPREALTDAAVLELLRLDATAYDTMARVCWHPDGQHVQLDLLRAASIAAFRVGLRTAPGERGATDDALHALGELDAYFKSIDRQTMRHHVKTIRAALASPTPKENAD